MDGEVRRPATGPKETPYPDAARRFAEPSFIDPDTDGDGILDGNDDQDHDGYPNWFEASRPADWVSQYASTIFPWPATPGRTNPLARVNPFNPCKPIYSDACHSPAPLGYYEPGEDWASNVTPATAPPMGTPPGTHALARSTCRDRSRATGPHGRWLSAFRAPLSRRGARAATPGGAPRRGRGGACPRGRPTARAWWARGGRARRGAAR